jgi:hypothetical protein
VASKGGYAFEKEENMVSKASIDLFFYFRNKEAALAGPRIEIRYPHVKTTNFGQTIETRSPTKLNVAFVRGESGDPVDMSSLEVIGKKGLMTKKLTDKLLPYIKESEIEASDIKIPTGKFQLEVSIADTAGVKTVEKYILLVGK